MTDIMDALGEAFNQLAKVINHSTTEVPEEITKWPEESTHLRNDFWKDRQGDTWSYRDGRWKFQSTHCWTWVLPHGYEPQDFLPLTRTKEPKPDMLFREDGVM